jgi:cytoskeletal protein RodZ
MKTTCTNPLFPKADEHAEEIAAHESTYAMLVRSEEKERTFLETLLYVLVVLSVIAAIWQFAHQPIPLPPDVVNDEAQTVQVTNAQSLCVSEGKC